VSAESRLLSLAVCVYKRDRNGSSDTCIGIQIYRYWRDGDPASTASGKPKGTVSAESRLLSLAVCIIRYTEIYVYIHIHIQIYRYIDIDMDI